MKDRLTAGILYFILAIFAFASVATLLNAMSVSSWDALSVVPGAQPLVLAISTLGFLSAVLGCVLVVKRSSPAPLGWAAHSLAAALPALAFCWNLLAPLFWLSPLFFIWRARRKPQPDI